MKSIKISDEAYKMAKELMPVLTAETGAKHNLADAVGVAVKKLYESKKAKAKP